MELPHPLTRRRVCYLLLWFTGGTLYYTLACGRGGGGVPIQTRRQTLLHCRFVYTVCMYFVVLPYSAWRQMSDHNSLCMDRNKKRRTRFLQALESPPPPVVIHRGKVSICLTERRQTKRKGMLVVITAVCC